SAAEQYGVRSPRQQIRERGLSGVRREIAQEIAQTLGRTGRRLEAILAELSEIEARLDESPTLQLERAFSSKRNEAFTLRENLKIQREALGLRNHERVHEFYPLPAPRN